MFSLKLHILPNPISQNIGCDTNIKGARMKWERRREERSTIEEEEFTTYNEVCQAYYNRP
jgi:hypothetical protein